LSRPRNDRLKRYNEAGTGICVRDRMLDRAWLCLDHRPSISSKNDDSYWSGGKVLLERDVLVASYEDFNACRRGLI
jgi:hypothetical protein